MAKKIYPKGTRVLCIEPVGEDMVEYVCGTLLKEYDNSKCNSVKVEFDFNIRGHDCDGRGRMGFCWNVDPEYIIFDIPSCKYRVKQIIEKLKQDG